uniref:Uncharacterized protein n=1 Tax=Mycena chlorophos TaxID=658473 RepID=A0ABQ0LKM5_MYCCL|nr:predicted protein [Mycena chlorophos]
MSRLGLRMEISCIAGDADPGWAGFARRLASGNTQRRVFRAETFVSHFGRISCSVDAIRRHGTPDGEVPVQGQIALLEINPCSLLFAILGFGEEGGVRQVHRPSLLALARSLELSAGFCFHFEPGHLAERSAKFRVESDDIDEMLVIFLATQDFRIRSTRNISRAIVIANLVIFG